MLYLLDSIISSRINTGEKTDKNISNITYEMFSMCNDPIILNISKSVLKHVVSLDINLFRSLLFPYPFYIPRSEDMVMLL